MSTFDKAINLLLKHEGGYVNNPNDPGGATNYGVSLRFLQEMPLTVGDFDHDGDIDREDIKNMSVEDAKRVYKTAWWDKYKYGMINDQTIATKVFDLSVNMGAKRAHILLQEAMNKAFSLRLTVDGMLGNASFATLNAIGDGDQEQKLITAYCNEAYGFYQRLIANKPSLKVFEKGWKNRAYSIGQANSVR
jgi:lysozyme family protein